MYSCIIYPEKSKSKDVSGIFHNFFRNFIKDVHKSKECNLSKLRAAGDQLKLFYYLISSFKSRMQKFSQKCRMVMNQFMTVLQFDLW